MNDVLNIGLVALILGLAVWTIVAREAYAAVVGFIAYGLLLTLVWVQLHGIDVALTEAAIGGGLTGALLIGAAARLRSTESPAHAERPGVLTRWLAAGVQPCTNAIAKPWIGFSKRLCPFHWNGATSRRSFWRWVHARWKVADHGCASS